MKFLVFLISFLLLSSLFAEETIHPLKENYILGELKSLRTEMLEMKSAMIEKIAEKELKIAEKSLSYSSNAMNYFFVILAGVVSTFTFLGLRTIKEVKQRVNTIAEKELDKIMNEYQERVSKLENDIQIKGDAILKNQEAIHKTQKLQKIWIKINQEENPYKKLQLYNNLLAIQADFDVEILKGRLLLELEEEKESSVQFYDHLVKKYPYKSEGFYYRAKAYLSVNNVDKSIENLEHSISLSSDVKQKIVNDSFWSTIQERIKKSIEL